MNNPNPRDRDARPPRPLGGLIHTYQKYDPKTFPSPTAPPPDLASAAFEHLMMFGERRRLTPEELARAVKLDISQIAGMGPSLEALIAMLEERKRKILETYRVDTAQGEANSAFTQAAAAAEQKIPDDLRPHFDKAVRTEQLRDLERLWYAAAKRDGDDSDPARAILAAAERLGDKYQVEELASDYRFTGREKTDVPKALELKEELEAIDRLLVQLREAMKNAQIAIIDLEELARFASEADLDQLRALQQQVEDYLRAEAERQGLEETPEGYNLTPQAYRTFQGKLLREIFSDLEAARSGRHEGAAGEGAVELPRTKPYEFGDSVSHMDIPTSFVNAMIRGATQRNSETAKQGESDRGPGSPPCLAGSLSRGLALHTDDIEIHHTRNNPKCATAVLMDMSGSMRYEGQYINAKRMAIALDGLIRREYPGDFLRFIEMATFAKVRPIGDIPKLLPKPVTTHAPVVRLKVDMAQEDVSELLIPPHFTNIQHALRLARQLLAAQDTPNRQVILLTDGLPTAHFEGSELFLLYPPDPRTEEATMREAFACKRENITINIFLLPNWAQSSEDIAFAHRLAEETRGRVFFTAGSDVDRYVLWDYVKNRRTIIG